MSDMPRVMPIPGQGLSTNNYQFLREHIYRESGIVLDGEKQYLLEARLMPIVVRRRLGTLDDLCTLLRRTDERHLRREVVEAMTTNETQFFRDTDVWAGLRSKVIPELMERRKNTRTLRFWSAACSSGQEAYSLAMLASETGLADWNLQILATDFSQQMLERACRGRYTQLEVGRGLAARHLIRHFTRCDLDWELKAEVRRMVQFEQLDLRDILKRVGSFDLVLCRNVLIYFDIATKKKILQRLRGALFPRSYLVLGSAETTLNLDDSFERRSIGRTTFYVAP